MPTPTELVDAIIEQVDNVIHGKEDKIKLILAAWIAGGHVLLEDLPGTGKTILSKSLAKVLGLAFNRIQFTPDMLPSDITGGLIIDSDSKKLILRKGPIFSTFLLGDEINRATPRTQSALLEAMAEKQITIDGNTHQLHELFFVIATQNPIEQHGTFPLPEAQLDRFMIKCSLGYTNRENEIKMMKERESSDPFSKLNTIVHENHLSQMKELCKKIEVHDTVYQYILDLIQATRDHPDVSMGASPRASLNLLELSKAIALIDKSTYVRPSNVYDIFQSVVDHRIILKSEAKFEGKNISHITKQILKTVKSPVIK